MCFSSGEKVGTARGLTKQTIRFGNPSPFASHQLGATIMAICRSPGDVQELRQPPICSIFKFLPDFQSDPVALVGNRGLVRRAQALHVDCGRAGADEPTSPLDHQGTPVDLVERRGVDAGEHAGGQAGMIVGAVGSAFYYHLGVWGALETRKIPNAAQELVESLHLPTHYVTCLVRFGRVFCGLGLTVLAMGLLRGEVLPWWVGGGAAGLGVAAMALTMLWPDNWALHTPVFHLQALWQAATGAYLLLYGIGQGT